MLGQKMEKMAAASLAQLALSSHSQLKQAGEDRTLNSGRGDTAVPCTPAVWCMLLLKAIIHVL